MEKPLGFSFCKVCVLVRWGEVFEVEASGEDAMEESAVGRFVEYVKLRKVVHLEDLAAEFRIKAVHVIKRLEDLEKMGRLSGIFDDRGKYIYITSEDLRLLKRPLDSQREDVSCPEISFRGILNEYI